MESELLHSSAELLPVRILCASMDEQSARFRPADLAADFLHGRAYDVSCESAIALFHAQLGLSPIYPLMNQLSLTGSASQLPNFGVAASFANQTDLDLVQELSQYLAAAMNGTF